MWFRPAAESLPPPVRYTEGRMRQRPGVILVAGFGGLLLIMAAAFTLLFATLFLAAMRNEILRRRVRAMRLIQAQEVRA